MLRPTKTDVLGLKCMANVSPSLNANHCQKVISNNLSNNNSSNTNIRITTSGGSPLDALPKQFIVSMKKLFDILDDQQSGFVKFTDIEKGWHDDGCKGLPRGVIDSLRKVTPASGLLSFDRFCAGLKICLLRNQTTDAIQTPLVLNNNKVKLPKKPPRPPTAPFLVIENPLPTTPWGASPTATVRPQNIVGTQRAHSLPQLSPHSAEMEQEEELNTQVPERGGVTDFNSPPPPPKPPRSGAAITKAIGSGILTTTTTTTSGVAPLDKAEIRHALQNWQMGVLLNEMDLKDKRSTNYDQNQFPPYRGCADGGSSSTTDSTTPTITLYSKKLNSNKRREPRRHTLQNGIDYNILKRLKQFEEERAVLLLGLDAVDKAREWYLQQIASLQEKIQYLGLMGTHVEQWSEVHQERLNFQRARVTEVNRNLTTLTDTWERRGGFPAHFNLAIRTPNTTSATSGSTNGLLQPVDRLRQQNRILTNEVNSKTDRIALLEREKQALLRDLFVLQQRTSIAGQCVEGELINVLSQSSPVCSSSSGGLGDADVVY